MLKRKLYQTTFSVLSCIYEQWKACGIAGAWDARMQGEQAQLLAGFYPHSIVIPNCLMTLQISAKTANPRTLGFIEVRMRVKIQDERGNSNFLLNPNDFCSLVFCALFAFTCLPKGLSKGFEFCVLLAFTCLSKGLGMLWDT
jgi:hypothetical protein